MDFTSAVGYEQVDLDTCLLSERPKPVLREEDGELPPEPRLLPRLVRGAFFNSISRVWSERKCAAQRRVKGGPRHKGVGRTEGAQWSDTTGEVVLPECGSRGCGGGWGGASEQRGCPGEHWGTENEGPVREATWSWKGGETLQLLPFTCPPTPRGSHFSLSLF